MKNFKSSVITKSILFVLVLCIVFTVLGRLLLADIISDSSLSLTSKPFVYLIIMSLIYAVCIVISVIFVQGSAAKKEYSNITDNPTAFYLILVAIFIVISVIISLLCRSLNRDLFIQKSDVTVLLQSYHIKYPDLSSAEIIDKYVGEFDSGVVKGSIIGNIIQAVITLASVPLFVKRHNKLF